MAYSSLLSFSLCFLVLFNGCLAQIESQSHHQQQRRGLERFRTECRLENINVLEQPNRKIKSEAGVTEIWDQNQEELQCAGVVVVRHRFEPRGLLLPSFNNAPQLMYIVQGRGIHGAAFPGCPETFQSSPQQSHQHQRSQQSGDEHQKVRQFREGDIIALPAGVSHWIYNNGPSQLVLVSLVDQSNFANQLDQNYRKFFLAGNPQEQIQGREERESESQSRREQRCNSVFCGLDERTLVDAFNIDAQLAKRLHSENDNRGIIVRAKEDLEMIRPSRQQEEEEEEYEPSARRHSGRQNGLEETFCTMRLKHNIADPKRADIYNPRAGRISTVNSYKLPILSQLRLSAEHGFLYRNGIYAPHWNINAHSIMYVTRGSGRCQIVDNNGRQVFNSQLQEGQMLVVPQNFAVVKKATSEGFEWISFKTNENAKISQLAGRVSVTRAIPEEVLMNSFRISREEARRLKFNREEATLLQSSRSQSERE